MNKLKHKHSLESNVIVKKLYLLHLLILLKLIGTLFVHTLSTSFFNHISHCFMNFSFDRSSSWWMSDYWSTSRIFSSSIIIWKSGGSCRLCYITWCSNLHYSSYLHWYSSLHLHLWKNMCDISDSRRRWMLHNRSSYRRSTLSYDSAHIFNSTSHYFNSTHCLRNLSIVSLHYLSHSCFSI
jgi:hypothetical protein